MGQWDIRMSFANLEENIDAKEFADVARGEFSVLNEKYRYGCPRGLYTSLGA